jgi:hypothetical protein
MVASRPGLRNMVYPRYDHGGVKMRGTDAASGSLFSSVDLEARIPVRHPLRRIRQVVNEALASLDACCFSARTEPVTSETGLHVARLTLGDDVRTPIAAE